MADRYSIVIQAGGRSSRMGRDKGLVPLAGRPMIEHVIERVRPLADELLIITNRPDAYRYLNLPLFQDKAPGAGALEGLETACRAAKTPLISIIACDMPFVRSDLLEALREELKGVEEAGGIVPQMDGRLQPFHAVFRRESLLQQVTNDLANGEKRVLQTIRRLTLIDPNPIDLTRFFDEGDPFFNVNTPADLATAQTRIDRRP